MKIQITYYMKNGAVIDDAILLGDDVSPNEASRLVSSLDTPIKDLIKYGCESGGFLPGTVYVQPTEINAIRIELVKNE